MDEETSHGGLIKVSIPMSFGLQGISSVFNQFMEAHPNVRFSVDLSDQIIDLVEQGIDLAIRIADLEDSTLRARHLAVIRHLLVATPEYLEANGTPETIEDIANHDFLKYSLTRASTIIATDTNEQRTPLKVEPIVSANNADFLKKMTLMHRGIAYLPSFLVAEEIVNGDLEPILMDYQLPILNAYAIYPNVNFLSKRTRALIDFIIAHCGENPFWDRSISDFKKASLN
jgi:DNA-binding transcriptional LysR family regulator